MMKMEKTKSVPDKVANCLVFQNCLNKVESPQKNKSLHKEKLKTTIQ